MTGVEAVTLLVVAAVVIIGLVSNFSAKLGVAAPLTLVVVGAGLSALPWTPHVEVEPHVILSVILPPLLYTAALHMPFVDFRRNLKVIASLAVVLVAVSAFAAAGIVYAALPGMTFALAVALGAVVSPPDAVAAISLGKRLGLPPRVVTIMEGEGLVNDATALVLLSTAVSVATLEGAGRLDPWAVAGSFIWAIVGAVFVGLFVGILAVRVRERIADPVLDIAIALVVPFVTFIVAEEVAASGVVAVVIAGIWVGNRGLSSIPPARRRAENANWATFSMLVENGVFLLMGYLLPPVASEVAAEGHLQSAIAIGLVVSLALIAVRFAYVPLVVLDMRRSARRLARRHEHLTSRFDSLDAAVAASADHRLRKRIEDGRARLERQRFDITAERDQRLGWRDSVVLGLAGMRGVVTIAAAQTLPSEHPLYRTLVLVAFVVALATLLPQGLILPGVVRALRLQADSDADERREYGQLVKKLSEAGAEAMDAQLAVDDVDPVIREGFSVRMRDRLRRAEAMDSAQEDALAVQFHRLRTAQLDAERSALEHERLRGKYSSEVLARAQRMLDDYQIQLDEAEVPD